MLSGKLLRVLALVWAAVVGVGLCGATWPVEIDGKKVDAAWYALSDTPERLAVGDALYVGNENGGMWLCVRDTENLCFVNRLQSEALLYRRIGETLEVVGFSADDWRAPRRASAAAESGDDDAEEPQPPSVGSLPAPDLLKLWGVHLRLSAATAEALTQIATQQAFCSLEYRSYDKGVVFPKANFRAVRIDWSGEPIDELYRLLSAETQCLWLRLSNEGERKVDVGRLSAAKTLKVMALGSTPLDGVSRLGDFRRLRVLHLGWNRSVESVQWVGQLAELRELDISYTKISDLSPLGQLERLERLDVSASAAETLLSSGGSGLRQLNALGANLPVKLVAAFRADHPHCRVAYEWKRALLDELMDVDRLVVRSGGTCHRNPVEEKVLFETRASSEVAEFLGLIEIDEKESTGACMCCGSPTLELYAGERHLAMVGIQHGFALRWGDWPADGKLTQKSAWALTEWLARRGVNEPYDELHREEVAAKAQERSQVAFGEAIEAALRTELEKAQPETVEDFLAAISKAYPASEARVIAILRLVGAEAEASWNLGDPRGDPLCEQGLAKLDATELGRALVAASRSADARVVAGAARFFFRKKNWERFEPKTVDAVLPTLAGWSARSPRENVRSRLVRALEMIGSEVARTELRRIAAENPAARTLEPKQVPEGGQWKEFGPTDGDVPEGTPVALHAVLALARLGDAQTAELLGKAKTLVRAEDATVVARIEAILKDPKLAEEDRKTSGEATLGRRK
ncbi:MAG: hypothetical protein QM691_13545 [Opitutaceae bacterium]